MKNTIFEYIKNNGSVTYAEMSNRIQGFKGDGSIMVKDNLYFWDGISEPAEIALRELVAEGRIVPIPSSFLVYAYDGMALKIPIARKIRDYKKPRWFPIVFCLKR